MKKGNPLIKVLYAGERWIYKKADKLIFTMQGGKDYIIEKGWDNEHGGSIDLKKIYHNNNGVDLKVYNYNMEHFIIEDEDLMNDKIFKVVYTGSIRKSNNIECLFETAKLLKKKGINQVKILIWGDGDHKLELIQKVKDDNLDNIIFKDYVEKKYIPSILRRANILFLEGYTSELFRFGISPNKLFDYLAAGKPILSVIKTNYDIILENKCGVVVADNPEAISNEIINFLSMPLSVSIEMCNRAKNVAKEYDFENLTHKLIDIIDFDNKGEKYESK
jgi:glycosyltransferase involved in cell wall biosynthesis